jgi:hypothetical protein
MPEMAFFQEALSGIEYGRHKFLRYGHSSMVE